MMVHHWFAGDGYGQRLLRFRSDWLDIVNVEMSVERGRLVEHGHAPFRRVIDRPVSRSPIVTVSFPGRACHPLTNLKREGMAMTIVETRPITGGVDTHLDTHVAAALDANGGVLGIESFSTTAAGFAELHTWLRGFGVLERVGVEGTGAYGAGLARFLRAMDIAVIEVGRPNRQARRAHGKSDSVDAVEAARAALSGRATAVAKSADGNVEAIRTLLVAYRSGREARTKCLNQSAISASAHQMSCGNGSAVSPLSP